MNLDDQLLRRLEDLSCLNLEAEERKRIHQELPEAITMLSIIEGAPTEGLDECHNPLDRVNMFRQDEAFPSYDRALILSNAPHKNNEAIIAPKTVE
ncbi:MAG: Asp-tRNA(Asn)/Glu-tRNA(Gln) amidotransferase subunit GatC [Treponema sp.]|nr:Asp-tRNA(Asn)/Glu-tRNA(Gln) amidotransferase subunit GatC [Treponema sp.]